MSDSGPLIDPGLIDYATDRQKEYIEAIKEHGSRRAAGAALKISHSAIARSMIALAHKAALKGYAPGHFTAGVAPGYTMGKVTIQRRNPDGTFIWERQSPDEAMRHRAHLEAIQEACSDCIRLAPLPAPTQTLKHLLNLYVFTDYHLGMRAWSEEGGADWNMVIAEKLIIAAFQHMIASSPAAEVGFIGQLGDFMHFDGLRPVTPTSGHIVDAAASYHEIVRACIRILRALVDLALQKHNKVVILAAEGNHDLGSSAWMRELLAAMYENEPRVEVVNNGKPYYAYQWGKTMLAFHHGHGTKKDNWPMTFAAHFAEMWGRTTKRYAMGGHYHHEIHKGEAAGMKIFQFPTLAPNDRHSALGGYSSERQTSVMTFDSRFGLSAENIVTPQMLEAV